MTDSTDAELLRKIEVGEKLARALDALISAAVIYPHDCWDICGCSYCYLARLNKEAKEVFGSANK